jgi:hypothetical protein
MGQGVISSVNEMVVVPSVMVTVVVPSWSGWISGQR